MLRGAPFIVGVARSGTTLLRLMFDAHPEIGIPAETNFFPAVLALTDQQPGWIERLCEVIVSSSSWSDYGLEERALQRAVQDARPTNLGEALRVFYCLYAKGQGKLAWGDKRPENLGLMRAIASVLPEARFLHIIRDGRDVAVSLREVWFRPADSYAGCVEHWAGRIRSGREQAGGLAYMEVRYESLVRDPARVLRELCDFVDLTYDDAMLTYPERARARLEEFQDRLLPDRRVTREERLANHRHTSNPPREDRIGRWRRTMTAAEARACSRAAGGLLEELGY